MNEQIIKRIEALTRHEDPEVRWLAWYAERLTRAAGLVANHLQRLSDLQFQPRQQLEKVLEDENG